MEIFRAKYYNIATEKGLKNAERFKKMMEKKGYKVETEIAGVNAVFINLYK